MKIRSRAIIAAMLAGTIGCANETNQDQGNERTGEQANVLQVFSWWLAPGEAEALQALVYAYQSQHEGARVAQPFDGSSGTWQELLGPRIDESPWDVFQLSASDLAGFRSEHVDAVGALDEVYESAGLEDVMSPDIKDLVTIDGHPYGVVTGIHRNNAFIYNKRIFDKQGLQPPTTLPEFLEVSAALRSAGITPVATAMDTWVLRIVFDAVLAGTMGAQGFDDFVKGVSTSADEQVQAQLRSAIETFDVILTDYVDVERSSADGYLWSSAAQDLYDGKAAMLFHGDWAKGYLVHLGWEPGSDFGVLGPPGASDLFIYGADMFGFASTGPNPDLAIDFLKVVASPEGQVAFNKYKGSTPMRLDVRDQLDEPGQRSLDDLNGATVLMPGHPNEKWDAGIEAFAKDHDRDALLKVYTDVAP